MKKAIIIAGKYTQDSEYIYPFYRFKEAGFVVVTATEDGKEVLGVYGTKISADTDFNSLNVNDFDALIIPGGARAMEYIRQNQKVLQFIHDFNSSGKIIACICHGAQLLISAKVVRGRRISGYYSIKDDVENAGATYVDAPAVIDGNIITSPHYKHMGDWMRETMKLV